ncbi:MAG TPA: hypothetical protein VFX41_12300 [Actinomycetales bacterium]|nr:hypothetical protein [Actinomycetales bacterium]
MTTTLSSSSGPVDSPARQAHPSGGVRNLPAVAAGRRPSLARLTGIELRKSVDTRSGRVLMLVVLGLGLAGLAWRVVNAANTPVTFEHYLGTAMIGVQLVLPVVGLMAMTSEWTQRTALSTFTSTPRRGRIITAKVTSALLLGTVLTALIVVLGWAATLLGGAVTGTEPVFDGSLKLVGGVLIANLLNLLMASAFGALIPVTAAAIVAFLVAPQLWAAAGTALFKDAAQWLDVYGAFGRIVSWRWVDLPQSATSIAAWIVVPLAVGVFMSLRREVK